MRPATPVSVRLWRKVKRTESGCWEWTGYVRPDGYGSICVAGKNRGVHRVMYEVEVGPIPTGLVLDHLCRNRACCNPEHLEPVTHEVNVSRSVHLPRLHKVRTSGFAQAPSSSIDDSPIALDDDHNDDEPIYL